MAAPSYSYGDIGADIPDLDNSLPKAPPRTSVNILFYIIWQINIYCGIQLINNSNFSQTLRSKIPYSHRILLLQMEQQLPLQMDLHLIRIRIQVKIIIKTRFSLTFSKIYFRKRQLLQGLLQHHQMNQLPPLQLTNKIGKW